MGGGGWTKRDYKSYVTACSLQYDDTTGRLSDSYTNVNQLYKRHGISNTMNPYNVIRECRDTEEHPLTIPVILGLDVTGSMGSAALEIAKSLNPIMMNLYEKVNDVEFLCMAIGDIEFDEAPIQVSQFESDIRIAKALDSIYFEAGGGYNNYESYSAAWWVGAYQTDLDCWKRGKKGIIITIGDEPLNPSLGTNLMKNFVGDTIVERVSNQGNEIRTTKIFNDVCQKYDVFHIAVKDERTAYNRCENGIKRSFGQLLKENLIVSTVNELSDNIVNIITSRNSSSTDDMIKTNQIEISW